MAETERFHGGVHVPRMSGRPSYRLLAVALAVAALVVGGVSVYVVRAADKSSGRVGVDWAAVLGPAPQGQPVVSATIQLEPGVTDIASGFGAVWASTAMAVVRIDPLTNGVAETIPVAGIGDTGKLAVGEGAVWVTHGISEVSRIDPSTSEVVATIDVGPGVRGIAVGGGRVWVTREPQPDEVEGYLVQIDPAANEIVGSPLRIGVGPGPVTFGAGAAWVTLTAETGALVKVDPGTMTKVGQVDGIRGSAWFVAGEMWAATGESIARIDPSTSTVVGEIPMPFAREVDFGSNAAWVLNDSPATAGNVYIPDPRAPGSVVEIDPLTGRRVRSPVLVGDSPSFMAAGEGAVWVAQYDSGLVTRIDPQP